MRLSWTRRESGVKKEEQEPLVGGEARTPCMRAGDVGGVKKNDELLSSRPS
jgi:hypothetical protein